MLLCGATCTCLTEFMVGIKSPVPPLIYSKKRDFYSFIGNTAALSMSLSYQLSIYLLNRVYHIVVIFATD